jgi:NMD protein affecting ribosome stability and mRNA decay
MVQEYRHDTYRLRGKLKEPTVCSGCGALFHKGRWTWGSAPSGAQSTTCPACHRIRDKYPMGLVTIMGNFKEKQHEQVVGIIHNTEVQEKKEHPLSRIMGIERRPEGLVISTTDTHLPRRVGEALKHAYHGELSFHYDQDEEFVRVTWTR